MIDGVRYSIPGDWVRVEADGSLTLLGRGSNCINTAGEKVYPEEVEEALKHHESVADALVVGLPDEKWGQAVMAVVQLKPGFDLEEYHCAISPDRNWPATRCQSASLAAPVWSGRRTAKPTTS